MADAPPASSQDHRAGHRDRLRGRLLADAEGLLDHEIVEYLLMVAIPRIDTKPLAKALLHEFGGIGGLLTADGEALARLPGMGPASAAAIKIAQAAAVRLLRARVADRPVIANWQALLDYLHAEMAHHVVERFRVLHLNTRMMLIRDEVMDEGTIDNTTVHVREVIRRCLELGSAAIVLVHNHPSGNPGPSTADIDITRALHDTAARLGIALHDHLIIGTRGHVSLKAQGLF